MGNETSGSGPAGCRSADDALTARIGALDFHPDSHTLEDSIDLVRTLGLSRSNVSNALKELRGWNLIGIARTPGDRKEYFTAPPDPWDLVGRLIAARQRHVVAPLLDRVMTAEAASADVRLAALHDVLRTVGAADSEIEGS